MLRHHLKPFIFSSNNGGYTIERTIPAGCPPAVAFALSTRSSVTSTDEAGSQARLDTLSRTAPIAAGKLRRRRVIESMTPQELIARAYSGFNRRDIDGTLVLMSENVSWPKASEGGRVVGKQEIRNYWTRQLAEFDPRVNVLVMVDRETGKTDVKVHQLVKNLKGDVLSDTELWHVYTIANGLIERMDIKEGEGSSEGPSAAFSGRDHAK